MKKKVPTKNIFIFSLIGFIAVLGAVLLIIGLNRNNSELILYGNVDIREVDLSFRVPGKVEKLFFDEGDKVVKNQELATLDKKPYQEEFFQAYANVEAIKVTLENLNLKLQRREKVSEEAISKEDFDDALYSQKYSEKKLLEAKATLELARIRCKDTKILAPCNGTIISRIREPGSILSMGEPVYTLSLDDPVWIRAYIDEPNLGEIYPGMEVTISTDTSTNPKYLGQIGFISPIAEFTPKNVETTALRTDLVYRIRIVVNNPDKGLRQGMPVTILPKK